MANSKKVLLDNHGISGDWRAEFDRSAQPYTIDSILEYIEQHNLENVVVVDNTASASFVQLYPRFVTAGCDIVSSNKVANTISYDFYSSLRALLRQKGKTFLYETNVGAGLPLVDTIRQLHHSGDKILRIRGVFSGTLSYIFNHFAEEDRPFYDILREAMDKGLTEPDPREDLCGNDVARKLLILDRPAQRVFGHPHRKPHSRTLAQRHGGRLSLGSRPAQQRVREAESRFGAG